ncbi:MAG: hypothetical protein HY401_03030 [Elusimicrobia bacterium]|nr:hypothetical protein [Elusimicrobiota bacterium]
MTTREIVDKLLAEEGNFRVGGLTMRKMMSKRITAIFSVGVLAGSPLFGGIQININRGYPHLHNIFSAVRLNFGGIGGVQPPLVLGIGGSLGSPKIDCSPKEDPNDPRFKGGSKRLALGSAAGLAVGALPTYKAFKRAPRGGFDIDLSGLTLLGVGVGGSLLVGAAGAGVHQELRKRGEGQASSFIVSSLTGGLLAYGLGKYFLTGNQIWREARYPGIAGGLGLVAGAAGALASYIVENRAAKNK